MKVRKPAILVARGAPRKHIVARDFRKAPTDAEAKAWHLLRARQILGLKFPRQMVVRGFIVDFYCAEHALAVEIDGDIHKVATAQISDEERTLALNSIGITVVRLQNEDVDEAHLIKAISKALKAEGE